ncbi:hypothetical protein PS6_010171 [Mucor atramentarius]
MSSSSSSSISAKQADATRQSKSRSRSPSPTKKTVIETRRAEQNRAAQRAFRQRKELYVKELEAKLKRKVAQLEQENSMYARKTIKLDYASVPTTSTSPSTSSSSSSPNAKKSTASTESQQQQQQQQQQTEPKKSTQPKQAGEKGKVLDDLVSILKTRNRPPIQYHQYQPPNNL